MLNMALKNLLKGTYKVEQLENEIESYIWYTFFTEHGGELHIFVLKREERAEYIRSFFKGEDHPNTHAPKTKLAKNFCYRKNVPKLK